MKRILLLTTILLTGVIFAQDNFEDCNNTSKIIKNDFRSDKSVVVIWEEDFGGGFPSGSLVVILLKQYRSEQFNSYLMDHYHKIT